MTITNLLNLTNTLSNGSNQFTVQQDQMNRDIHYYNNLINLNVLPEYGVYAICHPDDERILYIGKGGTIQNNGVFKNQNLNGRLKAPRGGYKNSYLYFKEVMNQNNFHSLIFLIIYSNESGPPAYIESISLLHYLNQSNCLPMLNYEF